MESYTIEQRTQNIEFYFDAQTQNAQRAFRRLSDVRTFRQQGAVL